MTEAQLLATSTGTATSGEPPDRDTHPPLLLRQAVSRVRIVALLVLGVVTVSWLIQGAIEGFLWEDFQVLGQWGPPTSMIVGSVLMYWAARSPGTPARTVVVLALAYEVAVSFGIALSEYWGAFEGLEAAVITGDVVGYTSVALWMLMFTVLVPVRPGQAVIGLLGSAAATPITYLVVVGAGDAPVLPASQFFWVFVFRYLVVAALAYIAARVIYRLGKAVQRARELGSYRLEQRLGEGGMGEVWRANHRMLARPAAVKLISPAALGDPTRHAETLARFEREAQATAALQSPHSVQVFDYGVADDGRLYYAMELLEGIDLERLVDRFGPLPPERAVYILEQACESLAEAHRRELVHRDIKPSNLFLCRYALQFDVVKVLDFGLAKHTRFDRDDPMLSRTGEIRGTPAYLPPEMALDEAPVDGRVDLYGLGCVAYWLLTGALVFDAASPTAMIIAHATQPPVPPSQRSETPIPPELDELVLACLAKAPSERLASAEALAEGLAAIPLEHPWTQERAAEWWALHGLAAPAPERTP
jgi:serine/threonine-protein kinase